MKIFLVAILAATVLTYVFVDQVVEPREVRAPASIPDNYESLGACAKQEVLWNKIQETAYQELPDYRKLGFFQLLAMSKQEIANKDKMHSDFAPQGWKKYLHGRGAIAKVKLVPKNNSYSGIFKGSDCALLRLSLTYKTAENRAVAPGLAFKILRDGMYSANISALVSLDGQEQDFNFFRNPMSNIVPIGEQMGQKIVHTIFRRVSRYPEELLVDDMAKMGTTGAIEANMTSPRQIFFVPSSELGFSSAEHDVREDFFKIPEGQLIYRIYAAPEKYQSFDYSKYTDADAAKFLSESVHIADLVSTSPFVASEFGDDGIFFRHQLRK